MTRGLPASTTLATACRMSSGARNWPFLMLTTRPVCAAATSRSVWRHRNAGICRTSATSAAGARLRRLVDVGQDRHAERGLDGRQDAQPFVEARAAERAPGRAVGLVEGGLEDERHAERASAISTSVRPGRAACASLSMTHGPAMRTNGRSATDDDASELDGCHGGHYTEPGRRIRVLGHASALRLGVRRRVAGLVAIAPRRRSRQTADAAASAST